MVTGASKGSGSGIVQALAAAGARVAVNYASDRKGAERVAQIIINGGSEAIAIRADVSKASDVVRLFKEIDTVFGRLDVLVNNAGSFASALSRRSPRRVFTASDLRCDETPNGYCDGLQLTP